MTQPKKHCTLSTRSERKPPSTDKEEWHSIIEESQRWVERNKGYILQPGAHYLSPRISSEIMDCSMPMTFDHFNYCSLGCLYCFAYFFKSNNPAIKGDVPLKAANIEDIISGIEGSPKSSRAKTMHKHFYAKKFLLHWGGLADPFCSFERKNAIGYKLLEALGANNYPCLFSFKGDTVLDKRYQTLFSRYSKQANFAFQISMVTADKEMAKKVEVGVPAPSIRLQAMRALSAMGYFTILRLRPFIIGVTDESLDELLERCLEAGISGVSMEFFAVDNRANVGMKSRYTWLSQFMGIDNLLHYFSDLSPSERGGYLRLNRLVKEQHVKKVYAFCAKNKLVFGCSDPDFKELNTSGSCCAMPDSFPKNRLLENWTHDQLTYHIKELRRAFHRHGEIKDLHFADVYGAKASYLDDVDLTNDHVAVTNMMNAERYAHTYRSIIQGHWNNLRSPANPRNYFHGKLLPTGLDAEGNLIYRYNPMEYEERWKAEGIDLTR